MILDEAVRLMISIPDLTPRRIGQRAWLHLRL
jgi:hypothetical protein